MPLLAPNRRALAARFPEILALLDKMAPAAIPPPPMPEEADAFVTEAASSRRVLLVLTGLPGRLTAAKILADAPRETLFWCIEPDPAPLAARLATEDLAAWLADPRVFVSLGAPATPQLRRLNRELAWVDRSRAVLLPTRAAGADALWRPLLVTALARIQQRWQNVFTDLRLSPVRWTNTCANLPAFLATPGIESLAGAFTGVPLVLVAAGPSLDDALPFLKKVRDHALIVTGNTSYRALASRGIPPHLTVSVDPFPTTDRGYEGQPIDRSILIAPVFVHPAVPKRFAGRFFGLADESMLLARLRTAAKQPDPPALMGEGTVSATILNLAAYLGCSQVVFVGQDFAIADDGRTHASDTFYTDLGCNRQADERLHDLTGTTRPKVRVSGLYLWYLRVVENLIARAPKTQYLNTSHRGAAIAGAPFASYDEAATLLTAAPRRDLESELATLHTAAPPPAVQTAMVAELARARTAMREALKLSLTAALANELALADPTPANRRRFDNAAQRFEQWRDTRTLEEQLLFEGRTKPEIFEAEKRRIRLPVNEPSRALREAGETAWSFAEGAAEINRSLQRLELAT